MSLIDDMTVLAAHLRSQGVSGEDALELMERKAKNPRLVSTTFHGKHISLSPPMETDGVKFDEMIESGRTPCLNTDSTWLEGHCNGGQFAKQPQMGDYYKSVAESHGQSITGRVYKSQLARFPGDPEAWVSGRGDAEKLLRQRGWGCSEGVNVEMPTPGPPPEPVPIAEHVVERETARQVAGKGLSRKEIQDVKEKTRKRLTPRHKRK